MDASTLAILAAGTGMIGAMAYLTLPRAEDHFDRPLAELFELATAPGYSSQRPWRAACANTSDHHQPGSGHGNIVEWSESPPPISVPDCDLNGCPATGPLDVQSERAPFYTVDGSGVAASVSTSHRPRPVIFRVK